MRQDSDTYRLLKDFLSISGFMADGILDPRKCRMSYVPDIKYRSLPKQKANRAFHELKRSGYCFIETLNGKTELVFTTRAQHRFLMGAIVDCKKKLKGKVCYVSFDLPIKYKKVREGLRKILKEAGFEMVHHSLWRSDKNVARFISMWIAMHHAQKYIKVFVGKEVKF